MTKLIAVILLALLFGGISATSETWSEAQKKALRHCKELFPDGDYEMQNSCMDQQKKAFEKVQSYNQKEPSSGVPVPPKVRPAAKIGNSTEAEGTWFFVNRIISECTKSESPYKILKKKSMGCKVAAQQGGPQGKKAIILSCAIKGTEEHLNMGFSNSLDLCEALLEKASELSN